MSPFLKRLLSASVVLSLSAAGLVLAQNKSDTPNNPFTGNPAAIAAGNATFDGACSACHGLGATGGRGPALNTGNFAHGGDDYEIFQTIQNGVPGTEMPPFAGLPSDQIWQLVTYIKNLSARVSTATAATGDPALGEALFFGKAQCSSCHEVNGRGLDLAVDLSEIGAKPLEAVRDGVLHRNLPRRQGPAPRYLTVTLNDGRVVTGLVRNEDSFGLHLQQRDGQYLLLDRAQIKTTQATPGGVMPSDVGQRLTAGEVDDMVAYLSRQKARDFAAIAKQPIRGGLSYERLVAAKAEPQNWLTYWGDYQGRHFSELKQIDARNVSRLQARWSAPLLGASIVQTTPIVVDGVMYASGPPGDVYVFNAKTGMQIWKFHRKQDVTNPYQINPYNRGVAVLGGRVFVGTLDNLLIALDARTGRQLWEKRIADTMEGYTLTGAPLALKDKIIVGMSGGEMGVRGFLDAYDPATGERLWRFNTVPQAGEPAALTWSGDSWKHGSGATWLTGSYDPDLDLIYWTVGNPGPNNNPDVRKGDNLYTDSVIALDAKSGQLKWHYQFTPNDSHDWDAVQDVVLADKVVDGKPRKVLLHGDRNGFFYMLDRTNGAFLWAKPFVHQTWNKGFSPEGRPIVDPATVATAQGQRVFPAVGGTNFQAPSYDDKTGTFFIMFEDSEGFAASGPAVYEKGKLYTAGRPGARPAASIPPQQGIKALDSSTGEVLWTFPLTRRSFSAGLLGTRGGVLFAASAEGNLIALDMKTGKALWRFQTGSPITASPMSYAVDGQQFVAVPSGNMLFTFALPAADARP
ncbi:MAG: Pyrrolo-quinoline quinone [Caulobacter sp.]|nr:Pyrrolo-quinoline quinone [Caulobacter sp.]